MPVKHAVGTEIALVSPYQTLARGHRTTDFHNSASQSTNMLLVGFKALTLNCVVISLCHM